MSIYKIKNITKKLLKSSKQYTDVCCATIIKAEKGTNDFIRFAKGSEENIINTYGYPSENYPEIQDIIDINNYSDIYVARCSKNGSKTECEFSNNGMIYSNGYTRDKITLLNTTSVEFTQCSFILDFERSSDVEYTYKYYLDGEYVTITDGSFLCVDDNKYMFLIENNVLEIIGPEGNNFTLFVYDDDDNEISYTITKTEIETLTKIIYTYDNSVEQILLSNGLILDETVNNLYYYLNNKVYEIKNSLYSFEPVTLDYTKLFKLTSKDDRDNGIKLKLVNSQVLDDTFLLYVSEYDEIKDNYIEWNESPFEISLDVNGKNANNNNIYIKNVLKDYFDVTLYTHDYPEDYLDETTYHETYNGNKGDEVSDSDKYELYNALKNTNYSHINFVYDSSSNNLALQELFESLSTYLSTTVFVTFADKEHDIAWCYENESEISSTLTNNKSNYNVIDFVNTWHERYNTYRKVSYECSCAGLVVSKLVKFVNGQSNSISYYDTKNESNILHNVIKKCSDDIIEDYLTIANTYKLNVCDYKNNDLILITDFAHSSKNVLNTITNVLIINSILNDCYKVAKLHLGSAINETTFNDVSLSINNVLAKYESYLNNKIVVCDSSNNNNKTKQKNKIVCDIGLQLNGVTRMIYFTINISSNNINII